MTLLTRAKIKERLETVLRKEFYVTCENHAENLLTNIHMQTHTHTHTHTHRERFRSSEKKWVFV